MFRFMKMFALCFTMGSTWGRGLDLTIALAQPLSFGMCLYITLNWFLCPL
jgi:hypothetical protein